MLCSTVSFVAENAAFLRLVGDSVRGADARPTIAGKVGVNVSIFFESNYYHAVCFYNGNVCATLTAAE